MTLFVHTIYTMHFELLISAWIHPFKREYNQDKKENNKQRTRIQSYQYEKTLDKDKTGK